MATPADRYNIEPPAAAAAAAVVAPAAVKVPEVVEVQECATSLQWHQQQQQQQQSVHRHRPPGAHRRRRPASGGEEADAVGNHHRVRVNRSDRERDRKNPGGTEKGRHLPKRWRRTAMGTNGALSLEYLALVCVIVAVVAVVVALLLMEMILATSEVT